MTTDQNKPCDVNEILLQMGAIEQLKDIRFGLGDSALGKALGELIAAQESECERVMGECGNLDVASILSPFEDLSVPGNVEELPHGESLDAGILASLNPENPIPS